MGVWRKAGKCDPPKGSSDKYKDPRSIIFVIGGALACDFCGVGNVVNDSKMAK